MSSKLLDRKIWFLILAGGISLVLLYFLAVRTQESELRRIKLTLEEKKAFCGELEAFSSLISELKEKKALISESLSRFLTKEKEEKIDLVVPATLMEIAKVSEVDVVSIRPSSEERGENLLISFWDMSLRGSYDQLGEFISRVESSREFYRIETLTISSERNLSQCEMRLTVSTIGLLSEG